jgi:flavin reductase (DIM6/NTAB) family NADH-FMN oxidoreductase RutF
MYKFGVDAQQTLEQLSRTGAFFTVKDGDKINTMTIGWGGLGTLWSKPVATVYVKPCRYTHSFLENSEYFTVSFFDAEYKKALGVLGTKSGRDGDKVAEVGFKAVTCGESVTFEQAKLTLLCKKIYKHDIDVNAVPEYAVKGYYLEEEPHTIFIGEVIDIIE